MDNSVNGWEKVETTWNILKNFYIHVMQLNYLSELLKLAIKKLGTKWLREIAKTTQNNIYF